MAAAHQAGSGDAGFRMVAFSLERSSTVAVPPWATGAPFLHLAHGVLRPITRTHCLTVTIEMSSRYKVVHP